MRTSALAFAKSPPLFLATPQHKLEVTVIRGLAFLDDKLGLDWHQHINLETLNLQDGLACILAQATGTPYLTAVEDLGVGVEDRVLYGFFGATDDIRERLAAIWRRKLGHRRERPSWMAAESVH
jgi:hypothetical protein